MEVSRDYFSCANCHNKDFKRIYNFSISFHSVNFLDELIYDKTTDMLYQCTKCGRTFTPEQIEQTLNEIKKSRKKGR